MNMHLTSYQRRELRASLKAAGMVALGFGVTALLVLAGLWNAGLI